jgi:hypothetical protein
MPSYTARNRWTKQDPGSNTNTWGDVLNLMFDLMDSTADGVVTVSTTPKTLTTANGSADEARNRIINYTGASPGTITIPSVEKTYLVRAAAQPVTITNGSNSATLTAGTVAWVVTDGVGVWTTFNRDFAGLRLLRVGYPQNPTDGANRQYVDDAAFSSITNLPGQAGNAGKVLGTNGTTASWVYALKPWSVRTSAATLSASDRIIADTTGGPFILTLPATPEDGAEIVLANALSGLADAGWAGNALGVARNGATIQSIADDLVCGVRGASIRLIYSSTANNWTVVPS